MKKKSSVTYAKALFSCSVSADELQKQAESLKALADEVNTNDASADFFQNPFI